MEEKNKSLELTEEDMEKILDKMALEEQEQFKDIQNNYQDMFNAIIFNGGRWENEQNLYSGLKEFQRIDKLVEEITTFVVGYFRNKNINITSNIDCFSGYKCYVFYNDYIFEVVEMYGQGTADIITLIGEINKDRRAKIYNDKEKNNYDESKSVKIEDMIEFFKTLRDYK